MTSPTQSSRKPSRDANIEIPPWDGDTIVVRPRRPAVVQNQDENGPLKETRTRVNQGNPRRMTSHAKSILTSASTADDRIPQHCCYFCRTRGGLAAYKCSFRAGSNTCERCNSDKRGACRPATEEEKQTIAARCDYCTTRGFRYCNGETPCDVCIKHNKTHLCRKDAANKTKQDITVHTDALHNDGPGEQSCTARQSLRSRAMHRNTPVVNAMSEDDFEEQTTAVEPPKKRRRGEVESNAYETQGDQPVAIPANTEEDLLLRPPAWSQDQAAGSEETPMVKASKCEISLSVSSTITNKKAVSTDIISTTEDDELQPTQVPQKRSRRSLSESNVRPRRSSGPVSYVEAFSKILSDEEAEVCDTREDDESDAYISSASIDTDVDVDIRTRDFAGEQSPVDEESLDEEDDWTEEVIKVEVGPTKMKAIPKTKKAPTVKLGKGPDLNLPPLSTIEDAFGDMAAKAVQLGLSDALQELKGRHINVATMCSGTESPLLALDLLSRGLKNAGLPPIKVRHHFSAEIEVMKQGYIERNFSPSKIFRDVREFLDENATHATTAYGAQEPIPSELDILIAGFVCKDLSQLNNKRKDLEGDGESGDTFRAVYAFAKRFRPGLLAFENVMSKSSVWQAVVEKLNEINYEATWLICDTKNYYLPQTRLRMYMIAADRRVYGKEATKVIGQWRDLMQKLQRQCSSPYEAFLVHKHQDSINHVPIVSEPDWALCKLRYDHIRSQERLGILRPITKWNENGTVRPHDFANRAWYTSQSSRVYDAIEVAHLQAAQNGYDSLFKMAVWDVSQNVDRFKGNMGILPCITPGGCDFATNRQQALNGTQLLLLQGMPMDKLIFARETQKDCQDLAGNAMSTTVIGASLVSAIISGRQGFRGLFSSELPFGVQQTISDIQIIRPSSMTCTTPVMDSVEQLDLSLLQQQATLSARLCHCEGDKDIAVAPVHVCSSCGHTACARCAGSPKHSYSKMICRDQRAQTPNDFVQTWRPKFPTRLRFANFPDIRQLVAPFQPLGQHMTAFVDRLIEMRIASNHFCLQLVLRQDTGWKFVYSSTHTRLELRISSAMEWFMFVDCPAELAGNSPVRKIFEGPVAHAKVNKSLLKLDWKMHLPIVKTYKLQTSGSASRCNSWRSRLGLLDYKTETVPKSLKIRSPDKECRHLAGDFHLLPHCGTASTSLYRRENPIFYLLLDPSLIGASENDGFVFSHDCGRKQYDDPRMTSGYVQTSWRPWHIEDQVTRELEVRLPGLWLPATMSLETAEIRMDVSIPGDSKSLTRAQSDCSNAVLVFDAQIPESLPVGCFKDYSWALQRAKHLPIFPHWQSSSVNPADDCSCAPAYPSILWHVDDKGIATPHEDRKAAASFERSIKTRSPVFQIQSTANKTNTQIQISLNIAALKHRAIGRLHLFQPTSITTSWRLMTDHASMLPKPVPKFHLKSNKNDAPSPLPQAVSYLKYAQPKSLTWMRKQELGKTIEVTEVEEAIEPNLGWRAEARVQIDLLVRGGVLADLPSFGKTVTTIALIQSEFEACTPDTIIRSNQRLNVGLPIYVDTAATLIVCPPHIALQWETELKHYLGPNQYEKYNVLLVESFVQLQGLSIDDLRNSRVIIVSWTIFAEEEYVSHLAEFTAMPEPSITGRRAFNSWLARAIEEVPSQLVALEGTAYADFKDSTKEKLEERLHHADFQATLPIKIQHGSAYKSFKDMQATSESLKAKATGKFQLKCKPSNRSHQVPLLHLMRFNRIVVDEYHYLNDDKKLCNVVASISVKRIFAHKRWVLSGTPALGSFNDVDQIASYLDVKLGRYCRDDCKTVTRSDKTQRTETTLVEDFLAQTEIMSGQWHRDRHERAQEFLDLFVRQNEACLGHISCSEEIVPLEMEVDHHAVYLELSQHLISQKMQIKKMNNKMSSDRIGRLNASLNNSDTAEDALLKCALVFESSSAESGLDQLRKKREEQCRSTALELGALMAGFEGLHKVVEISKLYAHFKDDIKQFNWLGDEDASKMARHYLVDAEHNPNCSAFPGLKKLGKDKLAKESKKLLSNLRETARELALRIRSARFISAIQGFLQPLADDKQKQTFRCDSPQCKGIATISQLYLISQCGHAACGDCLTLRADPETCVHPSCSLSVQSVNLVKVTDLGTTVKHHPERWFGKKLETITDLVSQFPEGDQGLVFAPNIDTVEVLETVFDHHGITYHSLRACRASASAKIIEDFKNDKDPATQKKVLILDLGSESAAGVNLTNANHIIFVSPLLSKTQYEFDSAMAQAIARSRRYGQTKKVFIYHVIAQRTIDVDILEHRDKRTHAIAASESSMKMPPTLAKREKTRLIKNKKGEMALVPLSWLADAQAREMLDVDETPESFTSLINFSEMFEHDED